jgi:hypothetical protein
MGVLKSVEPTGFLAFAPAFAEQTGRMWIGGSSKIARTAEEEFCLRPPVWFRLCRLRRCTMVSSIGMCPRKVGFSVDSPLEGGVSCELVSECQIPCYLGKYREFRRFGPRRRLGRGEKGH